jgi:TRAP-type uncharacterized transport system substrate-binding protein
MGSQGVITAFPRSRLFRTFLFSTDAGMPGRSARTIAFPLSALFLLCAADAAAQTPLPAPPPTRHEEQRREINEIAVSFMVSGLTCTCARFAEDIRNVVNDIRPGGMRVLPILGVGGLQNINDMLFLRGVDMATVDLDSLKLIQRKDPALYANLEQRVHYITKLYNAELHVLARDTIGSLADLVGKVVNFDLKDSETQVTGENIFSTLQIAVRKTYFDNDQALQKLAAGEISAMIVLTGAPQSALLRVRREDGFHFVPVSEATLPGRNLPAVLEDYLPAELTADAYPNLVPPGEPVPTLANRALLAVYSWPEDSERYRRLARFVQEFFGKIEQFRDNARHPKWKEINLAATVPGWTRFKPAQEWLDGKRSRIVAGAAAPEPPADDVRASFQNFIERYQTSAQRSISAPEREQLFREFRSFIEAQGRRPAAQ